MNVELTVSLKIPDVTAITAKNVLHRLGISIGELKRADYYLFEVGNGAKEFGEKIKKADIIVNSNKHSAQIGVGKYGRTMVLVKNSDDSCDNLLHVLKQRLGFREIESMQHGVLWSFDCDEETAVKATERLLYNRHFQEYRIIGGA